MNEDFFIFVAGLCNTLCLIYLVLSVIRSPSPSVTGGDLVDTESNGKSWAVDLLYRLCRLYKIFCIVFRLGNT